MSLKYNESVCLIRKFLSDLSVAGNHSLQLALKSSHGIDFGFLYSCEDSLAVVRGKAIRSTNTSLINIYQKEFLCLNHQKSASAIKFKYILNCGFVGIIRSYVDEKSIENQKIYKFYSFMNKMKFVIWFSQNG